MQTEQAQNLLRQHLQNAQKTIETLQQQQQNSTNNTQLSPKRAAAAIAINNIHREDDENIDSLKLNMLMNTCILKKEHMHVHQPLDISRAC